MYILCVDTTNFGARWVTENLDQKVVKAELFSSGFLVEHSLPLSAAVHASELFRNMFSDSKIASKYWCGLTKTTHILAGAVTEQITSDLKEELLLALWNGLATDGSSNEGDKFLFFLVKTCW